MTTPYRSFPNAFKRHLAAGETLIGCWCSLANPITTEVLGIAGFDWLLLDGEHSPNDVRTFIPQLMALKDSASAPIVRPSWNETVEIKRLLDAGFYNFLIPFVQTADDARRAVAATRYPPEGVRGVSGLTRATRFGRVEGYFRRASEELCLIVQVETQAALDELESIAGVDGVDGVFIGPADLAASLGYPGEPNNPAVQAAVVDAIRRIRACNKPAGILSPDTAFAQRCIEIGTTFTAVAIDIGILARGAEKLAQQFRAE
jgi:2-keto-3-deoxy-L-rhamnonate aldolase RhmA